MNPNPTRRAHIAASLPAVVATLAERPELAALPVAVLATGVVMNA